MAADRRHLGHLGRRHERGGDGREPRRRWRRRPLAPRSRTSGAGCPSGARYSPFRRGPLDVLLGRWTLDNSPMFVAMDLVSRLFSPYDLNPGGLNPLREILAESVDFTQLARAPIKLFITATNVRTGRGRVFRNAEITPDVMLASACLPTMFQAVEIDGDGLLGRRLLRQPDPDAAGPRMRRQRHDHRADQPDRAPGHAALGARHPQPAQRDLVQRGDDQGAADDRRCCSRRPIPAAARVPSGPACASTASERRAWPTSATPPSSTPSGSS